MKLDMQKRLTPRISGGNRPVNNDQKEFKPANELGVFYLFARNHEKLGYPSIVEIRSNSVPDIVATTSNGKRVGIELEYKSERAFRHYRVLTQREQEATEGFYELIDETKTYRGGQWTREGGTWEFIKNGITLLIKEDPSGSYWYDESTRCLLHRTVKTMGID